MTEAEQLERVVVAYLQKCIWNGPCSVTQDLKQVLAEHDFDLVMTSPVENASSYVTAWSPTHQLITVPIVIS